MLLRRTGIDFWGVVSGIAGYSVLSVFEALAPTMRCCYFPVFTFFLYYVLFSSLAAGEKNIPEATKKAFYSSL